MASKFKLLFGGFVKSVHQLWLEVSGTLLIAFGAIFGLHAFQEYRRQTEADTAGWQFFSAAILALLTLGFGLHSFWKSRNLR